MCGISGTINANSVEITEKMKNCMRHRGPDDEGLWHDESASLGHNRLSILDISSSGHQPMSNEDETLWITYNGEIYNFQKLKQELVAAGHNFRSDSDTEVILHLYEEFGEDCLLKLRGMFAFAIWDRRRKRLFAARDRLGIKPFFYQCRNNYLIFCSELKALLASGAVRKDLNINALGEYFRFGSVQEPENTCKRCFPA